MAFTIEPVAPVDGAAVVPDALVEQHVKPASDDASLIQAIRLAAIDTLERFTARSFQRRAWRMTCDGFACAITLPRSPVSQVTSITYLDANGVSQQVAAWRQSGDVVMPVAHSTWPVTLSGAGTLTIDFVAGFDDIGASAPSLRMAALLMMRHLYDGGDEAVPGPIAALCRGYRVPVIA